MLRLETEYSINVKYFYFRILRAYIYVETRVCTFNNNGKTRYGDKMWNANKRNVMIIFNARLFFLQGAIL